MNAIKSKKNHMKLDKITELDEQIKLENNHSYQKNSNLDQGYMYMAFQSQGNEKQDLTLKNIHYNKHQ